MNLQWLASTEWALVVKALLHTLWQGAIIAGLLVIALRRVDSPIARYRGSLAALASILLAGLVTWAWLNLPAPKINSPAPAPTIEAVSAPVLEKSDAPPIIVQATPLASKPIELGWTAWMAFAWLLGAMLMLGRAGFQVAGAERLRRSTQPLEDARIAELLEDARKAVGLARTVRLAVTNKLTSPAVVGVLVPTLILPISLTTTLSHEQIRFILLHELAHIRRGDYFANLFQLFAEALLFFNPAVWWISRQMRIEREACCDALAIELSGAPADYARTLVHVAENVLQATPVAAPAFGDEREPSSLADRVQRLLVPGYRPRLRLTWRAMLASLCVGGALLVLSALGTRVTVAAILSPQQRIERIEKRMTELGEKPVAEKEQDWNDRVSVVAHVRTADGAPLPKDKQVTVHSSRRSSSGYYGAWVAKDGTATNAVAAGEIWVEANAKGYAPAIAGPFDGKTTNYVDVGELILDKGFEVQLHVTDANTGAAITNARLQTWLHLIANNHSLQGPRNVKTDDTGKVTLPFCIAQNLNVTVNAPGYEIASQQFEKLSAGQTLEIKLQPGAIVTGNVVDKVTGQGIAGATLRVINEKGAREGRHEWTDAMWSLGQTEADGRFTLNQLRRDTKYWIGVSAPGHESVIVEPVTAATRNLIVKLGPELIVRGRVIGSLAGLSTYAERGQPAQHRLQRAYSEVVDHSSYGESKSVPLLETNGVVTFEFTNHLAYPVTLTSETGFSETRNVTAPIDDWVVDLSNVTARKTEAKDLPKREVIFHFKHPSGVSPRGTVQVLVPDNLDPQHGTAHYDELAITNGEVRVAIAIGGRTTIEAKRMVGYWFNRAGNWTSATGESGDWLSIEVRSNSAPLVIDIPLIPAGAIYARAKNADGTPAGGLFFGVSELKRAPGRDQNGLNDSDGFDGNAPRQWISGPLPLGGKYQIYGHRENSFCLSQPIRLTEANPDAEVELQFAPGKTFNGGLRDMDGKPLRDTELKVSFTLSDNHGFGLKSVFTDANGRFELKETTPDLGEYSIEAAVPGSMAERIKLDFSTQPQVIRLKRAHTLAGRVIDFVSGQPIPGMEVRALDYESNKLPMQTAHTDEDGYFEFNSLGDANYTLYPDGGELLDRPRNGNLKFQADGRTNLTLRVKLYEWSKLKPKGVATNAANPTLAGTNYLWNTRVRDNAIDLSTAASAASKTSVAVSRSSVGSETNAPMVIITAQIYRMRQGDFEKIVSDPAYVSAKQDLAKKFQEIKRLLTSSGFQPIQRPRIQTNSGMPAQFYVGDETNSIEFACQPIVTNGLIDLTSRITLISAAERGTTTNEVVAHALFENGSGRVFTIRTKGELNENNTVVVTVDAEIITDKSQSSPKLQIKSSSTNQARMNVYYSSEGRRAIAMKLENIRLEKFSCDSLPLSEVLRQLAEQSRLRDTNHAGINFLINDHTDSSSELDPLTGLPTQANSATSISYNSADVPITVAAMENATLGDVLDAVVKGAGKPVCYSIRDFGIEFKAGTNPPALITRTYRVDTNTFPGKLGVPSITNHVKTYSSGSGENIKMHKTFSQEVAKRAYTLFTNAGVDLNPALGKALFYNDTAGILTVRAPESDQNIVDKTIQLLNWSPQIHIKARFIEVPKGTIIGFQNLVRLTNTPTGSFTRILLSTNARAVLRTLESQKGFETLAEPEVVTISGRQTQMRATEVVGILTNMMAFENPTNHEVSITPQVAQLETGVMLDVVPYVMADGYTLSLALIPSWVEFHGYAETNTHAFYTSSGERVDVPGVNPLFRVQQLAATVNLWDGQSAVLGGMTLHKVQAEKIPVLGDIPWMGKLFRKRQMTESDILVFVTATIVDAAGNRVHTDEELPFAQTGVPPQPTK